MSRERIEKDADFVRTRENNAEFGNCCHSGKVLRMALSVPISRAKDAGMCNRLVKVLSRVKDFDGVSARGQRTVGLESAEGKLLLKGFNFNAVAALGRVLLAPVVLDQATGVTTVADFVPAEQLLYLQGATHVSLQGVALAVDFGTEVCEVAYSNLVNLPINMVLGTVVLTPTAVPVGSGVTVFLMMVSFYQEINGVQYSLIMELWGF